MNWEQLKTILWLRWRLARNQWGRHGGLGAAIAAIVGIGALGLSGTIFFFSLLAAALLLKAASPLLVWGVWLGVTGLFLFLWLIGLINELQRSETIDLQRLLHMPVALGQIFLVNYFASHFSLSIIVFLPAMLGVAIGLTISKGIAMLLLVPLVLGMVCMITAWTYYLRGWLASLMTNPRRRRTIIMALTLGFVLIVQGPNLYFNVYTRESGASRRKVPQTEQMRRERAARKAANLDKLKRNLFFAETFIPPLWLPAGARALAEESPLPALFGAIGCFAIGAVGLQRAYRSTLRFYQGQTDNKAARPSPAPQKGSGVRGGREFLALRVPGVPEQAAAIALASFRAMVRAPEVKLAWGTSFLMPVLLGSAMLFRSAPKSEAAKPFVVVGVMTFSLFMLVALLANQFGFDRDGFRAFVLSPVDRKTLLLGKNLACLPLAAGPTLLLLVGVSIWLRVAPFTFLAALFQMATILLLAALGSNVLSIFVPYRMNPGSLKPTKVPGVTILAIVAWQLLFPMAMAPVFVPPLAELFWSMGGLSRAVPVNLILSMGLLALTAFAYRQAIKALGPVLQRRETKILGAVTSELE